MNPFMNRLFKRGQQRASRIDITPPQADPGRNGIAICAIMRNEERHIGDWLRFHAVAGVRDFILYDNLSTDGTVDAALAVKGVRVKVLPWKLTTVTHRPQMIIPQQIMAYCHAISTFGAGFRWMAFIDIDEFIIPRRDDTILEALAPLDHLSNISLPWTMFGSCGHVEPPAEAAPFAYTLKASAQAGPLLNFKCIVDPCRVTQVSTHKFRTSDMGDMTANDQGETCYRKQRDNQAFLSSARLQLNHYYTRSEVEMAAKIARGAVSGVQPDQREAAIRVKIELMAQNPVKDIAAPSFLARHGIENTGDLRRSLSTR